MNSRFRNYGIAVAALVASASLSHPAVAQKINCSNEFRSGKLYFSQGVFDKAVDHFALSVEACPEKGEYRARYAMALSQRASELMDQSRTMASTPEEEADMMAQALDMYKKSGAEFDSSLVRDDSKKNQKFVRENRKHYWVDHYNQGLKLAKEEKYDAAAKQLAIARDIDPSDIKAYTQGAVVLIKSDRKSDAASLVQEGLKVDPENKELNALQESIFKDAARSLIGEISSVDPAAGVAKADSAIAYLNQVHGKTESGGEDPNVYFELGLANLEAGSAVARADTGEAVSSAAKARFLKAADQFKQAADLVPADGENRDFHVNAMFDRMQSLLYAREWDQALAGIKNYLSLEPTDAAAWQFMAQVLVQKAGNEQDAVLALMTSKSLQGQEISADDAITSAKPDEKAVYDQMGRPDKVYTYQVEKSDEQVNVWFWFAKKQVAVFTQGAKSGVLNW